MLSILKNRDYFRLWLGQAISSLGDHVRNWAMVYWVYQVSDHSPLMIALSFIATQAPSLFVSPIAGVWVDRWDRRRVMLVSDLIRGVLSLGLIAAAISGRYGYAMLLAFLASCVGQFFGPARTAMIRRVVGQEHLLQANSLAQTTEQVLQLAGPALGTAIYTILGARLAFGLDSASFFLSALCIALVATSGAVATRAEAGHFLTELKEGLRFCWECKPIRAIITAGAILFMGGGAINALAIVMVQKVLGLAPEAFGYISPLQPLASLITALAIGAAARKSRRAPLLVAAGMAICAVGIGVMGAATNLLALGVSTVIVGVGNVLLGLGISTTMQSVVPDSMMGRVSGVFNVPLTAAMLTSAAVAGAVAETVNPRWILLFAAVMIALGAVSAFAGLRGVVLSGPGPEAEAAAS
jgi:MFS transporter, DHA3 family, macrolide efflux protein